MSGRITVPMAVYTAEVVATEDLSPPCAAWCWAG